MCLRWLTCTVLQNSLPTFPQVTDTLFQLLPVLRRQAAGLFKAAAARAGIRPSRVLLACRSSGFSLENIPTVSLLLSDVTKLS